MENCGILARKYGGRQMVEHCFFSRHFIKKSNLMVTRFSDHFLHGADKIEHAWPLVKFWISRHLLGGSSTQLFSCCWCSLSSWDLNFSVRAKNDSIMLTAPKAMYSLSGPCCLYTASRTTYLYPQFMSLNGRSLKNPSKNAEGINHID